MTPVDVLKFYGTRYRFAKETKMSANTLGNWMECGFIPEDAQYRMERITNGQLKANERDMLKCNSINKEELAFMQLKRKIVKLMLEFNAKYDNKDHKDTLYPRTSRILVDVLSACLNEATLQLMVNNLNGKNND